MKYNRHIRAIYRYANGGKKNTNRDNENTIKMTEQTFI